MAVDCLGVVVGLRALDSRDRQLHIPTVARLQRAYVGFQVILDLGVESRGQVAAAAVDGAGRADARVRRHGHHRRGQRDERPRRSGPPARRAHVDDDGHHAGELRLLDGFHRVQIAAGSVEVDEQQRRTVMLRRVDGPLQEACRAGVHVHVEIDGVDVCGIRVHRRRGKLQQRQQPERQQAQQQELALSPCA